MSEHPPDPEIDPDDAAEGEPIPDDPGFGEQDEQLQEQEWEEDAAEGGELDY